MSRRGLTGYATFTMPLGSKKEWDTFTCGHCNSIRHVKAGAGVEDLGGWCGTCAAPLCENCVGRGCDPLEEKLKRKEAREAALRSYGM